MANSMSFLDLIMSRLRIDDSENSASLCLDLVDSIKALHKTSSLSFSSDSFPPTDPQLAFPLPQELLIHIFSFLPPSSLFVIARVCKSWSTLALSYLYYHPDLYNPDFVIKFTNSLIINCANLAIKAGLNFPYETYTEISRLRQDSKPSSDNESVSTKLNHTKMINISKVFIKHYTEFISHFPLLSHEQKTRLKQNELDISEIESFPGFVGYRIKKLTLPSCGSNLSHFALTVNLLKNLQCLRFKHPIPCVHPGPIFHGDLLYAIKPLFSNLLSLVIEDLDAPCFSELCHLLQYFSPKLIHLSLETKGELESFESDVNFEKVADGLVSLKCLRMDGVPVGDNSVIQKIVLSKNLQAVILDYCVEVTMDVFEVIWNSCPSLEFFGMAGIIGPITSLVLSHHENIRTLRLVDCDVSDTLFENVAYYSKRLEMLRIVFEDENCEGILKVADTLSDRTINAFSGTMFQPFPVIRPLIPGASSMDKVNLQNFVIPLKRSSGTLKILAITKCVNFSVDPLKKLLAYNPIHTLDLHKHPQSQFGKIEDEFFKKLMTFDSLNRVKILNLFGQTGVSESCLLEVLKSGAFRNVESVCLNNVNVTETFLNLLGEDFGMPKLRRISVFDCSQVSLEMLKTFITGCCGTPGGSEQEKRKEYQCPRISASWEEDADFSDFGGVWEENEEDLAETAVTAEELEGIMNGNVTAEEFISDEIESSLIAGEVISDGNASPLISAGSSNLSNSSTSNVDTNSTFARSFNASNVNDERQATAMRYPAISKLYTSYSELSGGRIISEDQWFMDESLDILSLWGSAVAKLGRKGEVLI
ncbi:hypothetical protein HK098_002260 [Nowakowskiella sp. JEL0407]|nr:hypothetical protein HK098_002260 [Nowakowskiella sp. JEL0407]